MHSFLCGQYGKGTHFPVAVEVTMRSVDCGVVCTGKDEIDDGVGSGRKGGDPT